MPDLIISLGRRMIRGSESTKLVWRAKGTSQREEGPLFHHLLYALLKESS